MGFFEQVVAFMNKNITLFFVLLLIVAAIWYLEPQKTISSLQGSADISYTEKNNTRIQTKAAQYPRAKELADPTGFINTDNFSIADLIGKKVILIDFWTYSCINCQRTLPYIEGWYEKYKDQGLVVIGVHTPEFEFEKEYDNVKSAVDRFGLTYPTVMDSNYGTWSAYDNHYWPRKYLIDIDGFIVYDHAGEGAYEQAEEKIQDALKERMEVLGVSGEVSTGMLSIATQTTQALSPETYFGAARNSYLANGQAGVLGIQSLGTPEDVVLNRLYLTGTWNFDSEFATNQEPDDAILYNYFAKNVYFVASAETPVNATILIDGKPIAAAGADVHNGIVTIQEPRLYSLVSYATAENHVISIIPEQAGLRAYTFTFG